MHDSADKAARFVMDCNQTRPAARLLPGCAGVHGRPRRRAARHHPQRREAGERRQQLAPSRRSPSSSAARSARATTPCAAKRSIRRFIFAWPNARYAVMGAEQATGTLVRFTQRQAERSGKKLAATNWINLRDRRPTDYRSADRHPLRRGPRLGRRDHRPAHDARCV